MKKIVRMFLAVSIVVLALSFLTACGGGGGGNNGNDGQADPNSKPQDFHGGTITLNDTSHVIELDLSTGIIRGVIHDTDIKPSAVDTINFNSERVGFKENSVAVIKFDPSGKMTIPNTANNDSGIWTLRLKSGEFVFFNIDRWSYEGKPYIKTDENITYGGSTPATINFIQPNQAVINFGSNVLSGLMEFGIDPNDVAWIQWNSDRVGWNEFSLAHEALTTDARGNYTALITVPNNDKGNFSVKLKNGTFVWFNINGGWEYSTNVVLDQITGQIEYNIL